MKYTLTLLFTLLVTRIFAQTDFQKQSLHSVVDERTELLSIIFRLAGSEEYNGEYLYPYTNDIKKHFQPYVNHPAIRFAKKMVEDNSVGFDAVMAMGVHIGQAPDFKPLISFTDEFPDKRWGKKNAQEFTKLLQAFYRDANCRQFFADHAAYYATAQQRFDESMGDHVDLSWYEKFYGVKPEDNFKLVIGLGNGGNNYGAKIIFPDGKEELYSIISNALPDSAGLPTFKPENIRSTIIHEYNHSFINHLIYAHEKMFRKAASKIFESVKDKMVRLHYGQWQIMVNESLVRAGEIQYDKMHGATEAHILKRIRDEQARGFVWMDKLVNEFANYEVKRAKYPTFESYLDELAKFYERISHEMPALIENYENGVGFVTSIEPLNATQLVDPAVRELIIRFNKPMQQQISINLTDAGMEHFPFIRSKESIRWAEDGQALILKVALKPSWDYSFILTSQSFRTQDGYPLKEQTVNFKTKAQ